MAHFMRDKDGVWVREKVKDGQQVQPGDYKLVPVWNLDDLPRHFQCLAFYEKNGKSADKKLSGQHLWQLAFLGRETSKALLYSEGIDATVELTPSALKTLKKTKLGTIYLIDEDLTGACLQRSSIPQRHHANLLLSNAQKTPLQLQAFCSPFIPRFSLIDSTHIYKSTQLYVTVASTAVVRLTMCKVHRGSTRLLLGGLDHISDSIGLGLPNNYDDLHLAGMRLKDVHKWLGKPNMSMLELIPAILKVTGFQAQVFPTLKEATAAALGQNTQSTDATPLPVYAAVPDLSAEDMPLNAFSAKRQKLMTVLEDMHGGAEHLQQAVAQDDRRLVTVCKRPSDVEELLKKLQAA